MYFSKKQCILRWYVRSYVIRYLNWIYLLLNWKQAMIGLSMMGMGTLKKYTSLHLPSLTIPQLPSLTIPHQIFGVCAGTGFILIFEIVF